MTLDFATAELLDQMSEGGGKPLHESTVEEARALAAGMAAQTGSAPSPSVGPDDGRPVRSGAPLTAMSCSNPRYAMEEARSRILRAWRG